MKKMLHYIGLRERKIAKKVPSEEKHLFVRHALNKRGLSEFEPN